MTKQDRLLPDFDNPPVVEVAISVQFKPLTRLRVPHFGLFWSRIRERFPKFQEQPPIKHVIEKFGPPAEPAFEISLEDLPPLPRCWFLNEEGTRLLQVQQDRFVCNWRKVGTGEGYPHFEVILEDFQDELEQFLQFVNQEKLGEWVPNQCEVTYVNHIASGNCWDRLGEIFKIFTILEPSYSDEFLTESEEVHLRTRYIIPDESGNAIGRLNILIEPRYFTEKVTPLYRFTLTARGKPENEEIDGVIKFLKKGREWIVRGFTSITTPVMHKVWERKQ